LGIRDEIDDADARKICEKGYLRKRIKNTGVLIIDEISMIKPSQFEAVNKICQHIKKVARPFGGMQVVCSGDFFQLPPVYKPASPDRQKALFADDGGMKFVNESGVWREMDMKVCYLDEQHRTKDKKLHKILNHIRNNEAQKSKDFLFGEGINPTSPRLRGASKFFTRLYTHNVDVDTINYSELDKIKGKEYYYQMTSRGNEMVADILKKSCLAPEKLVLKRGAEVMFIKNNFEAGYVNGTQGKVVDFVATDLPVVKTQDGKKITVKFADWTVEEPLEGTRGRENSVVAGISQIPLRLAWAITVHKSQGMNLNSAEMDLSRCFLEGMGYVALSRLKSLKGLRLMGINNLAFCVNKKALEIDKNFKKLSKTHATELKKMGALATTKRQKLFLKYLRS